MRFDIKAGVAIPKPSTGNGNRTYPFHEMEVGDSFEVPSDLRGRVSSAAYNHSQRHDGRFSLRRCEDGTYRCWRVE